MPNEPRDGLRAGTDGVRRCWWCGDDPLYVAYHDEEWGRPVADDVRLFEKLALETFMSGLSWLTILRKRENFRRAFHGFAVERVASFDESDVESLLQDTGIVRNRKKIEATINNAARCVELSEEWGSLAAYVWSHQPAVDTRSVRLTYGDLMTKPPSDAAKAMSKDLKRRGWVFVGPVTVYSFMEAMGLVNDHLTGCHVRALVDEARSAFTPPAPPANRH